jgi:hypothetical protein
MIVKRIMKGKQNSTHVQKTSVATKVLIAGKLFANKLKIQT